MIVGVIEGGSNLTLPSHHVPIHILGIPGMGKSTLLGHLAEQALENGEGVVLFDIKDGQLARDFASRTKHPDKVIYVAPGIDSGWTLNLLEHTSTPAMVDAVIDMFERQGVFTDEMMVIKDNLLHGLWTASVEKESTLQTVADILIHEHVRNRLLAMADHLPRRVRDHWYDFKALSPTQQQNQRRSTLSRLDQYLVGEPIQSFVTSPHSTITLSKWLDEGKAVVFDLVSGVPDRQVRRLGNTIMAALVSQAMSRKVDSGSRYWRVIADEFDQLAADPFVHSIDKLRSAKVLPVMANQNLSQIPSELANSLSGAPVKLYFRTTGNDVAVMERLFNSEDEAKTIGTLKQYQVRVHDASYAPEPVDTTQPGWIYKVLAMAERGLGGQTVSTRPWWSDEVPGQLEAIRSRTLRDRLEVHEEHPPRTSQPRPAENPQGVPTRGHQPRPADTPEPRSVPPAEQPTGRRTAISRSENQRGTDTLRQDVPESGQSEPEPPYRRRTSDQGRSDAPPPQHPEQIHDTPEPADPERSQNGGRVAGRARRRSGGALGWKPEE